MLLDSWTRFTTPASGVRLHSMGRKSMPCESSDCRVLCPTEYTEYACRALTDTGMCRLALSDEDKVVRDWFGAELQATGCEVSVDQMGNMFGIRSGNHIGAPTVAGSHLDTQPTGGRYDGILGVMAALEALRTLRDAGHRTEYPVGAVNWTK
jgi:hypothetical protein